MPFALVRVAKRAIIRPMPTKVTKVGVKKCRPFSLDVMVMNPDANFKFTLSVELSCTPQADPLWKLVFDLFKNINGTFQQVVHVSFQAQAPVEVAGVQNTAENGVNQAQSDVVVNQVHPLAKQIAAAPAPDPALDQQINAKMSTVAQLGAAQS